MSDAQQARLFQPFERLGREASEVHGVGLGLAITRHLVELMGGQISVHSVPDAGSTFGVTLQVVDAPTTAAPAATVLAPAANQSG